MKKQMKKMIASIVLVILITTITGCSGKVDPAEYLSDPVFSGCNGYGNASVAFDEEALIFEIIGEEPAPFMDAFWEWAAMYDEYRSNISCEYDREGLSNGDTLVVKIAVSGSAADKIKKVEMKYTVEGLPDVEYMDIFKDVNIQFSGISGNAFPTLSISGSGEVVNFCKFDIEPSYGLKNGDVVTVTIANTDSILNKFYTLPKTESMEYTVTGLEYYASAEDLPMDVVRQIGAQLVAEQTKENENNTIFTYSDVELYGIFFLTCKEGAWAEVNQLHFVIHYNMLDDNGDVRNSYYIPYYIENILVDTEGNISIQREDCLAPFFYDTAESYIGRFEDAYDITQIG